MLDCAGPTVAQLEVFLSSDYIVGREPFPLFHHSALI